MKRRKGKVYETVPDKEQRKLYTGTERTQEFVLGAQKTLELCKKNGIKNAILCKFSPSCDIGGITGKLLKVNGIEIINTF